MNVLITGGAGYIGSCVSEELLHAGHKVSVLDNLQQGHRQAVLEDAKLLVADIRDREALDNVFKENSFNAVMHMAAETVIEFSMTDPKRYFQNNLVGGINLLNTMLKYGVYKFIFSSTAAVYGEPVRTPINEDDSKLPINSYGESKLMFEKVLAWYGQAYGIKHVSFRYFNAAGASEKLGEDHRPETHLIPNIIAAALDKSREIVIFGNDYPTGDGSCIRDYVHVMDIAQAHRLALEKVEERSGNVYNLGNKSGFSVFEVIEATARVSGARMNTKIAPRRAGDPAILVAGSGHAKAELGWQPAFTQLDTIVETALKWHSKHPKGCES